VIARPWARVIVGFAAAILAGACGGAAFPAPSETPAPTVASATPAAPAAVGSWIVSNKSKATVRVREQLVGVNAPSDAVLVASGATGSFLLKDDGTFSPESKLTFDMTTLTSDQRSRDDFIKQGTLQTRQFPKAELVPTKVTGLSVPLPATGDFTFKLTGRLTIRGTEKEVTFDVQAERAGVDLTATATADPTWKFAEFGMSVPSSPFRVISVVDEIKLSVALIATLSG
jgi:polyisoprenoid-binding protein YceI